MDSFLPFEGTNNAGWYPEPDIVRGVTYVVAELRWRLPQTKVLLLGILPRHDAQMTEVVERINAGFSVLDNGNTIRYLNMRDAFYRGNGQFYEELYANDLWHLATPGYGKWYETMYTLFNEMLN